jgi:UDP-N-acetylbacillosamine N-acetyltransferase
MSEKIFIVGAFHEMIELAEDCGYEIVGLIDREAAPNRFRYPILCADEGVREVAALLYDARAVLSPDSPELRKRLHDHYAELGYRFATLVSPGAKVSKTALLDDGVVMQWGANASAGSRIGRCVRLNTHANVMHDAVIGDFTTIAPNAVVLGRVETGTGCYIGANATILPGLRVGNRAIIGAGSVVTKDVPEGMVVAGNPARALPHKETDPSIPNEG